MRPPTRGKKRKRTTGWLVGHEIHLEIEDVLDKIKNKHLKVFVWYNLHSIAEMAESEI